jgi:hypothetical protein
MIKTALACVLPVYAVLHPLNLNSFEAQKLFI